MRSFRKAKYLMQVWKWDNLLGLQWKTRRVSIGIFVSWPDCNNFTCAVREAGVSLGIMGDQLKAPIKPLNTIACCDVRQFTGGFQFSPHDAYRNASLSGSYLSDRCCFSQEMHPNCRNFEVNWITDINSRGKIGLRILPENIGCESPELFIFPRFLYFL